MNHYSIGIDIGGTNTVVGLVRDDGLVSKRLSLPTQEYTTTPAYISAMDEAIRTLMQEQNIPHIESIGIGAPNSNFYEDALKKVRSTCPSRSAFRLKS